MAIVATFRGSDEQSITGTDPVETGSFTPSADSELFFFGAEIVNSSNVPGAAPDAPTGGSLSWGSVAAYSTATTPQCPDQGGNNKFAAPMAIYKAAVGGSPSAMTVAWAGTDTPLNGWRQMAVWDVTGHDTTAGVTNISENMSTTDLGGGGSVGVTLTLGSSPATGHRVFVCIWAGDGPGGFPTPTLGGQSMTSVSNVANSIGQLAVFYRDVTGAETNDDIVFSNTGSDTYSIGVIGFELTPDASGDATGTASSTLADVTSTASGTVTAPTFTGTASSTLAGVTSSASGTVSGPGVTGTASSTLAAVTSAASGTVLPPPITGTSAVTLEDVTSVAYSYQPLTPTSISGRKILDQNGDVHLMFTLSSWGMMTQLDDADITQALEDAAGVGFNAVTVWIGGGGGPASDTGWNEYTNADGQDLWDGTPWQSDLGPGWASLDWILTEAARLGMYVNCSFGYSGSGAVAGTEWVAASDAQMEAVGEAIATRYLTRTNIVWHIMWDTGSVFGSTPYDRIQALFAGINTIEGASLRPVRWLEQQQSFTAYAQGLVTSDDFAATSNSLYDYTGSSADVFDAVYEESGATTYPVVDCEPLYVGHSYPTGDQGQQLRERTWAVFLRGGWGINFGHEDWWPFGATGVGFSAGDTWDTAMANQEVVDQSYAIPVLQEFVSDPTWEPSDVFVTTGEGSGDTRAAAGASTSAALAYFPSSRTIQVDTTILAGAGNVRLRWYDPSDGSYTSIATSEAQQTGRAVTHPGSNADSQGDWVLVVDLVDPISFTGTASSTLAAVTSAATGTVTAPVFTGTSAATLDDVTSTATGTHTPPVFTGAAASTLDDVTSTASGTHSPPGNNTGSSAATLDDVTSVAAGTVTPPVFTGTSASTLDAVTSAASGTSAAPGSNTGTASSTLDDVTSSASGTVTAPVFTGSSTSTLDDVTSSASGTVSAPGTVTGSSSSTLDAVTSAATGTYTPPPVTGTSSTTLADVTSTATGAYTPPPISGTSSSTLDDVTSAAAGTHSPPGNNTGTSTSTLADVTSTATGVYTPPPITGTSTSTLAAVTSVAAGTVTAPVFTGTSAVTLEDVTSAAAGAPGPPIPVGVVRLSLTADSVTLVVLADTPTI